MQKIAMIVMCCALSSMSMKAFGDSYGIEHTAKANGITWSYIHVSYTSPSWSGDVIGTDTSVTGDEDAAIPTSTSGQISVPSSLGGTTINGIGEFAFNDCAKLTRVTLPSSITAIRDYAFLGCDKLKAIVFNGNAPSLGYVGSFAYAFSGAVRNNATLYVYPSSSGWGVTIPGKWKGVSIAYLKSVKFDANGGSVSAETRWLVDGDKVGSLPTPTMTGATFNGWYTAKTGGTKISANTTVSANTTYYAQWSQIFPENSITATGYSGKYDGEEHKISVALAEAISDATVKYSSSENGTYSTTCPTRTDAGTTTTWYEVSKSGYASKKGSATVTITKREVTLTSGSASKEYDGTALGCDDAIVVGGDGFIEGEGVDCDFTGSQTMVGTSPNTFTYTFNGDAKATNYAITMVNGTLEVTKPAASGFYIYSVKQRYPWNGLVDFSFVFSGMAGMKYDIAFSAKDMTVGTNITMATVYKEDGTAANTAKEQLTPGTYNWVWNAAADLPKDWKCDRVTVTGIADVSPFPYSVKFNANGGTGTMSNESFTYGTAKALTANAFTRTGYTFQGWATSANGAKAYSDKQSVINLATSSGEVVNLYAVWKAALYMVVDLSSGAISYLDSAPNGGWTDNPYKQTKMAFIRISAGTFTQKTGSSSSRSVTISKDYYIAVLPMTYRQYEVFVGTYYDSYYAGSSDACKFAAQFPPFDMRGQPTGSWTVSSSHVWPENGHEVYASSPMGKLRSKTKLSLIDIPTEAQLTKARSVVSLGNSYNQCLDWWVYDLGNVAVTDPEGPTRLQCQAENDIGSFWYNYKTSINSSSRTHKGGYSDDWVYVRLCINL